MTPKLDILKCTRLICKGDTFYYGNNFKPLRTRYGGFKREKELLVGIKVSGGLIEEQIVELDCKSNVTIKSESQILAAYI